ncbi:hypothetical protein [Dyadobacter sp. CY347]|uniref:hypothetical protein n=1 Tax=Dyadobacter sp. CY347 TaxID=2909336 RepID=UPI001F2AFD1F|nr:hypothetical protein [Dyadobacter sp. CY347]MCF2491523.1 hypothetical protein [Dyadobacter sp. CY347]
MPQVPSASQNAGNADKLADALPQYIMLGYGESRISKDHYKFARKALAADDAGK